MNMEIFLPKIPHCVAFSAYAYQFYPAPEDAALREAFFSHKFSEVLLKAAQASEQPALELPTSVLAYVLDTRGESIHMPTEKMGADGAIVGHILLGLIEMQAEGLEPSVNKAIDMAINYFKQAKSPNGNTVKTLTPRKIREVWAYYKPSAHLWAAAQLTVDPLHRDHWRSLSRTNPLYQLALARHLLQLALTCTNKNAGGPILSEDEMWTFPDDIALPETTMSCSGLLDWQREHLKNYSARNVTNY